MALDTVLFVSVLPRIVCIVGPTSSGKTALSFEVAKKFNGEIINADARQIYRRFVIGTGQPTLEEQQGIPHHLFGFLGPERTYSVAEWKQAALERIQAITGRGKLPVLVGGTGLYIQSLVDNFEPPAVEPQPALRAELQALSHEALIQRLEEEDADAVTWIDLKNRRRVERALEVVLVTGKSFKDQRLQGEPLVEAILLGVQRSSDELRERINRSIDQMIALGWKEEVKQLHASGIPWDAPAMTSIGYRELGLVVRGELDGATAIERIRFATWQYAKRQITWFKRDERIEWCTTKDEACELVTEFRGE